MRMIEKMLADAADAAPQQAAPEDGWIAVRTSADTTSASLARAVASVPEDTFLSSGLGTPDPGRVAKDYSDLLPEDAVLNLTEQTPFDGGSRKLSVDDYADLLPDDPQF